MIEHVRPDLTICEDFGGKCLLDDIPRSYRIDYGAFVHHVILDSFPRKLHSDLDGLATTFNATLDRSDRARLLAQMARIAGTRWVSEETIERAKGEVTIKDLVAGAELAKSVESRTAWVHDRPAQFSVPRAQLLAKIREMLGSG